MVQEVHFRKCYEALASELRAWAFDAGADWPEQDFDLMVVNLEHHPLIIELAGVDVCPKRRFFLRCAYLIVGDAVRTGYKTSSEDEIMVLLDMARGNGHADLLTFVKHSQQLMAEPSGFDYDLWCDGGLARDMA